MADNNGDNFNGQTADPMLQQMYALATDVDDTCAMLYYALVEALGYDVEDVKSGKITHDDIIKYARACDTGDFV